MVMSRGVGVGDNVCVVNWKNEGGLQVDSLSGVPKTGVASGSAVTLCLGSLLLSSEWHGLP